MSMYEDMTVNELKVKAKALGIVGRHSMTKGVLAQRIAQAVAADEPLEVIKVADTIRAAVLATMGNNYKNAVRRLKAVQSEEEDDGLTIIAQRAVNMAKAQYKHYGKTGEIVSGFELLAS